MTSLLDCVRTKISPGLLTLVASATSILLLGTISSAPALAQDEGFTIRGFLRDSASGGPVDDALISIEGISQTATTDGVGEFSIGPIDPGTYLITLSKASYHPRSFRFTITAEMPNAIDIGGILLVRIVTYHLDLAGTVTDVNNGEPVGGAIVTLNGRWQTQSDPNGRFRFVTDDVEAGTSSLHVRTIGYESMAYPFRVTRDSATMDVELPLLPLPIELDEIVVEGRRVQVPHKLHGFFDRRDHYPGEYLTPWEIDATPHSRITDLLRRMPGIRVSPGSMGRNELTLTRGCREKPRIFIDGLHIPDAVIDDILNPGDLYAVEAYVGASRIPPEFERVGGGCGVIVFWTR